MLTESKLVTSVTARYSSVLALLNGAADLSLVRSVAFAPGTLANQADVAYSGRRTITAASNDDIDLNAGGLVDPFGVVQTFAKVRAIAVVAATANTADVVIGNATTPFIGPFGAAAHTIAVPPGGQQVWINPTLAGWPVTAATADILRLRNNGGASITYEIVILGSSA